MLKNILRLPAIFLISIILLIGHSILCFGAEKSVFPGNLRPESKIRKLQKLAIFPLINLSGNIDAPNVVMPLIENFLEKKAIQIVPYSQIDKFLNKRRIRNTGSINKVTVLALRRDLKVDVVLLGSIDQFSGVKDREAYMGLTLRLVETHTCSIIWMDTLSYSGDDFVKVLDIGRIKSADELSKKVVAGLIEDIPMEYRYKGEGVQFEIGEVNISSSTVGAEKQLSLSVIVEAFDQKPDSVRARLGGKLYELKSRGRYYKGKIFSPVDEGVYPIKLLVLGKKGAETQFAVGEVMVDLTAPKLKIKASKYAMRGLADNDYVLFKISSDKIVERWRVEIKDSNGKVVRSGKGYGALPRELIWRGEDDRNALNNDGIYNLLLIAWDNAGNQGVLKKEIRLDTAPPVVSIDVDTLKEDRLVFNMVSKADEMMEEWEFLIFDENSELIEKFSGTGDVPSNVSITVPDEVMLTRSKIMYTFSARDKAGNRFEVSDKKMIFAEKEGGKFTMVDDKQEGWDIADF